MSNFAFLRSDFPNVYDAAVSAEKLGESDPTGAAFFAGKTMELAVKWAFAHDPKLTPPYQDNISTLIHDHTFVQIAGQVVQLKAKYINRIRNRAVHEEKKIVGGEALASLNALFHFCYWFGRTYGRKDKPAETLEFDASYLKAGSAKAVEGLRVAFSKLQAQQAALEERDKQLEDLRSGRAALDAEVVALRKQVAQARAEAEARIDIHDYNEAETRDKMIDLYLREAGWTSFIDGRDVEYEVTPMPNAKNTGYADYVLWGEDGKPLAVVEVKRTRHDARKGQQQAKLYADALEAMHGRRPVIFFTNGQDTWVWDDAPRANGSGKPPRRLGGFYNRAELELMIQRRVTAGRISDVKINQEIAGRPYQLKAIGRIAEEFDKGRHKALLVMATGTGKTRTVVALVDAMMKAGLVKRALFLADRTSLVKQAVSAFKAHLPSSNPVNLVTDRDNTGRVYASTYPTMMGLIDGKDKKGRVFGPGAFDLVIIDEAHRSVYQRYKAIFDYFDSYLVGLTATPRDEVDRDTYELFDLETGVPTDSYDLETAIAQNYLVKPDPVSVPTKFTRGGIKYAELSQDEKDQWDTLEWDDGEVPDEVSADELNKFLFNKDTIDKVLGHLMTNGIHVKGGDRLGKTIIFAKSQKHAEFIEERFNANWPDLGTAGFARIITHQSDYAQDLIDKFSIKDKEPHIAISVDMLDTGIDVPEIVNLVFFKLVRSKTKFWQMVGRGTRLCPDLFGPGEDKDSFRIFDFCQNLEYFGQDPATKEAPKSKSLTERLFFARLSLVKTLESENDRGGMSASEEDYEDHPDATPTVSEIIRQARAEAQGLIRSMSLDNFVVRSKRFLVEKYQKPESWIALSDDAIEELGEIAGLPNNLAFEGEEAKRFDLLMYSLQVGLLRGEKRYEKLQKQLIEIAEALEVLSSVPAVKQHMVLIEDIQRANWWEGMTVSVLEFVRRRLRSLVHLVERDKRKILYSNFEDEFGQGSSVTLPKTSGVDLESFKKKARAFLRSQNENIALAKVKNAKPLTSTDLADLETMLVDAGIGTHDDIDRASKTAEGLPNFIRSLVGLDKGTASAAFAQFLDSDATADQIEFVQLIIDYLTENGTMSPAMIYESPFKEIAPQGPEELFPEDKVVSLVSAIRRAGHAQASNSAESFG
ncbi:DEAD/DEAH box helicase family protein [Ahrensia kielensis]|uniref:DEAD/DEAH box helicase family protein n=1 Tax=Ahrensia kielensis TaxID=76980 RepID=UPI0003666BB1|nr:DEAD/DEAH box helicase family protein [Ahrensia kielensis]